MTDISIRAFARTDVPALQAIRAAAFAPVFQSFRDLTGPAIAPLAFAKADEQQAALLDTICAADSLHRVFVAERGGAAIGFVSIHLNDAEKSGELGLNAVHPDAASRGVGAALYEHALREMKRAGMAFAWVSTGGDASHAPARRAYEKVGFGGAIPSVVYYKLL
ncbi:MAG: GNAT family N-acetyltransferase [Hyphomonadaceae bacterium]